MEEEEDVLIPPVPSKYTSKPLEVDAEAEAGQELPIFQEHEIGNDVEISTESHSEVNLEAAKESSTETKIKSKETTTEYEQRPFEVVHRFIRTMCFFSLLIWIAIIVILSILTKSSLSSTLVGLSPVLLTIIVTYILIDKYHLESGFLMIFPLIFTGILFMLGKGNLLADINYKLLSSINLIFGLLFEAIITLNYAFLARKRKIKKKEIKEEVIKEEKVEEAHKESEEEYKQEEHKQQILEEPKVERKMIVDLDDEESIRKFVSSIEDKAKAINAVIGRVYSVKHGGTDELRAKIKIDSEHYNEISQLHTEEPDKRKETATILLKKIKERLGLLQRPEIEVFERSEVRSLENLDRDKNGKDDIIDVLMKNDKDPVAIYYQGALDFCDEALKELEAGNDIITDISAQ